MTDKSKDPRNGLSPVQVIGSALAAAFGVQSSTNRDRDFTRGKPLHFIGAGIILTTIFVLCIIVLVRWVVSGAAG